MSRSWIALGESVLRFHGQIEPMCFIMPDTIACCLSHVTGNFRPTFGFRSVTSSRARARSHSLPPVASSPVRRSPSGILCFFSSRRRDE
jgi:hypothetical protein